MVHLRFVLVQSFGAEAVVPDAATLVVEGFVARGDDGGSGQEQVVKGRFGAFAAGAVDLDHCCWRAD